MRRPRVPAGFPQERGSWRSRRERAGRRLPSVPAKVAARTSAPLARHSGWRGRILRPLPSWGLKNFTRTAGGSGRSGAARTPSPPSASRRPESFPLICAGHADRCAWADGHWTPAARAPRVFPFRANRTAAVSQTWYPASDATLPVLLVRRGQTFARFVQLRSHTLQRYDVRDGLEASYQSKQPLTIRSAITPLALTRRRLTLCPHKNLHTLFPAATLIIVKTWKRPRRPSVADGRGNHGPSRQWNVVQHQTEASHRAVKTRGNFNACD